MTDARLKTSLMAAIEAAIIRKADLENNNKDGGLWIVINGKVYDVQDWRGQAPCGSDTPRLCL